MVSKEDLGVQFLLRDFTEWSVVRSFFCANGHNRHQIDGFNKFCHEILPHITTTQPPVRAYTDSDVHTIRFRGVSIHSPNMTEADGHTHPLQPFEARTRNLTYACPVFADIEYTVEKRDPRDSPPEEDADGEKSMEEGEKPVKVTKRVSIRVPFFRLPCIIGSDFCTLSSPDVPYNQSVEDPFERGGYGVVNGKEKMFTVQMRLRTNVVMVMKARKNDKFSMVAEVRSSHPGKWRSTSTLRLGLVTRQHRVTVFALVPFVMRGNGFLEVPLVLLFVVFGADRHTMMRNICFPEASDEVRRLAGQVVSHPMADMTAEEAMEWIARHGVREKSPDRCMATTRGIFAHEILPHIGFRLEPKTNSHKCMFLGRMARRLLETHLHLRVPDDRDNFANKTVHNLGTLQAIIFRQIFRNTCKVMRSNLYKAVKRGQSVNLAELINHRKITSSLRYHFATGNWSMQQNTNTGVVMPMPRTCHQVAVSFQRRINTQCNKDSRATECRFLHPSDLGINCINETPEGQGCGIVENLAMFTHISMGVPPDAVVPVLLRLPGAEPAPAQMPPTPDWALITVNGAIAGVVLRGKPAQDLTRSVRNMRLAGGLPFDLGVVLTDEGDVQVSTEVGRCLRPLYRVDGIVRIPEALAAAGGESKGVELWHELLLHGIVEYLDKAEEQSVARPAPKIHDLLAHPDRGYTHVEIDPVASLGILSASQPFPERNQSPRNIYQATMGKQCISLPVMNWEHRVDRHLHVLNYPQQPLVTTQMETVQDYDRYPHGMSAVVAIMCYGGFNQEDSILFSQSAIDRGFARITYYRTYSDHIKRVGAYDTEKYEIPGADVHGIKGKADYSKLDLDGFIRVGEVVQHGDVIIGKTVCVSEVLSTGERNTIKHDQSVVVREHDVGRVDKVIATSKPNGNFLVQVRLRFVRAPLVGDKFASRYAQKGTIGSILPREDMPFTVKDGIVPDIIMNPNAIPSRMTVGQLLECALGKAALLSGRRGNGTAFRGVDARDIMEELKRLGYEGGGKERMRNGMTGELIEAPIFIGPTYYQQLRHFVKDKIHSRSDDGSNRTLTRQPMEGRSRGGGFRFGEMERDAVICHGASKFMLDRMFYNSDKYFVPVCLNCGSIAIPKTNRAYGVSVHRQDWCPMCEGRSRVKRVRMPYATKLCLQELMALHVMPRVRLSNALENI